MSIDTGLGWQASTAQGTIGGLAPEQIQTSGVFPRPGGAQPPPTMPGQMQQQNNTGWPS